jgi:hypothetical protein
MRGIGYTIMAAGSVLWGVSAVAQYINGPAPPVTAGQFCAEMRGWIGMSRAGHTLRSVSCSGSGHHFTVNVTID